MEEIAGAATAMRRRMTPIRSSRPDLIDTCGTGGDGIEDVQHFDGRRLGCRGRRGVPVAKHGNRSATSRSGSADVLAALGVHIDADVPTVEACLDELGLCFCFAPLLHAAMKRVAAVRKQLGTPTIFNILGPLVNPASAPFQLLGVGRAPLQPLLAEALLLLGVRRAIVVHGSDGLDEVTLGGPTAVIEAADGRLRRFEWQPGDFGLKPAGRSDDAGVGAGGKRGDHFWNPRRPPRSAARHRGGQCRRRALDRRPRLVAEAIAEQAADAIDTGAARDLLTTLVERTNR